MFIRPKDYIAIEDKYFFAVVSEYQEDERALTWLRYIKDNHVMQKIETNKAGAIVKSSYPGFVFHSLYADIELHGIPFNDIKKIYYPEQTINRLLNSSTPDRIQKDAVNFIELLLQAGIDKQCLGITGSLMLDTHNSDSDIDMVVYGRENFFKVRSAIKELMQSGQLNYLDEKFWQDTCQRRDCSLSFEEYQWHESRKFNKCISGSTKVDISMIPDDTERVVEQGPFKKIENEKVEATVITDTYSFDFPARYIIEHESINEIVSYTATYTGQAEKQEKIEAAGYVEQGSDGKKRLLVGSSREATGEYIRVMNK
jgi:predicted nucleotidyltransferase